MQAENQFMYPQDISRSKKIWNGIVNFIQQHFRFIMLMLFINIPYLFKMSSFGRGIHHFLYMCFAIVCLTLIISLIPYKRVMRITKSIIELLSVLLLFLSLYFVILTLFYVCTKSLKCFRIAVFVFPVCTHKV